MKHLSTLIFGTILLAACAPTSSSPHGGGHTPVKANDRDLTISDQSTDSEITFAVQENGNNFTDYGISHTKEMHLIAMRDDLRHFSHLHPVRDAKGVWRIAFTPAAGGTYWFYADFVEKGGTSHTIRFERKYSGETGEYGIVKSEEETVHIGENGGYDVTIDPLELADRGVQFNYWIYDAIGTDIKLDTYLGELGHSVLISPSGEYVHVHPFKEYVGYDPKNKTHPVFVTGPLIDSYYRVFTQFQIRGTVHTAVFDWTSQLPPNIRRVPLQR